MSCSSTCGSSFGHELYGSIERLRRGAEDSAVIVKDPQKRWRRTVSSLRSLWALGLYRLQKPSRFSTAKPARLSSQGKISELPALAPIQRLPTELLLLIMDQLSETGVLALGYTCSRFYRVSPLVIEQVFRRYQYLNKNDERLAEQISFLNLLARDRQILGWLQSGTISSHITRIERPKQYKCITCNNVSSSSSFSLEALRGPQETRQCLLHEGKLWICEEHALTYQEARAYYSGGDLDGRTALKKKARMQGSCRCCRHYLHFEDNAFFQAIPMTAWYGGDTHRLVHSMFLGLRFCPHMTLGDPQVLSWFSPNCKRSFPEAAANCQCRTCADRGAEEKMQCSKCKTSFQFRIHRSSNPNIQVVLYFLTRKVLCGTNGDSQISVKEFDRSWQNHISLPFEFPSLRQEWRPWKELNADYAEDEPDSIVVAVDPFAQGFQW